MDYNFELMRPKRDACTLIKREGDRATGHQVKQFSVGEMAQDEMDTLYFVSGENPQALREIRQVIIQTIVKDLERPGLYHAEGFVDFVRDYLVENED